MLTSVTGPPAEPALGRPSSSLGPWSSWEEEPRAGLAEPGGPGLLEEGGGDPAPWGSGWKR